MRRPCFVEEDAGLGLASIASTEVGYSGRHNNPFFTRSRKSTSYRSLTSLSSSPSSSSSPRSTKFYDARCKEPHFLESCFLCKKHIGDNRDIFMYRGDTPFCSEECREEQIEMDEAKEKNLKFTSSMRNIRKDQQTKSNNKSYQPRTNTVAAA